MFKIRVTYVDTAHSATVNPTAIDAQAGADDDRLIQKIIVGKATAGATLILYTVANAYFGATTNIALKYTWPTFGAGVPTEDIFDFTTVIKGSEVDGLILTGGGSISTSSAMQVTILWSNPEA